ncbi:hypothetical protein BY996DRAFT_6814687 [Phakopsora pachyrhizi]|nr:hypothetical protein BY996DRAFT_6814687 [Phakopsora pachyrhizi]
MILVEGKQNVLFTTFLLQFLNLFLHLSYSILIFKDVRQFRLWRLRNSIFKSDPTGFRTPKSESYFSSLAFELWLLTECLKRCYLLFDYTVNGSSYKIDKVNR